MDTGLHVVSRDGVVAFFGELDVVSRDAFMAACEACGGNDVVVDLSGVTFLDCGGYRAFVDAKHRMATNGRTLTLRHAVGEPARLLGLLSYDPALTMSVEPAFAMSSSPALAMSSSR